MITMVLKTAIAAPVLLGLEVPLVLSLRAAVHYLMAHQDKSCNLKMVPFILMHPRVLVPLIGPELAAMVWLKSLLSHALSIAAIQLMLCSLSVCG